MTNIYQRLKNVLTGSCSMENSEASKIIRDFVESDSANSWEWDDFHSSNHTNPDIEIALALCWYYEGLYPSSKPHEYCAKEGGDYFLKIADALEQNRFSKLDKKKTLQSIKNKIIPDEIKVILDAFVNDSGDDCEEKK